MKDIKVICHMFTSMDGKIVTDLDGFPANEDTFVLGEKYDELVFTLGEAWGCGTATFQTNQEVDFSKYKGIKVRYIDKVLPATRYCVCFDRFGKLRFDTNINPYAGENSHILEVLTKKVSKEFIAYLDELEISYIFAGEEDLDIGLFLNKLHELCDVNTFVLCGGAQINARFMKEDYVDEISLIIAPGVQGGRKELTFVGTENVEGFPKYYKVKSVEVLSPNGIHLQYEKE